MVRGYTLYIPGGERVHPCTYPGSIGRHTLVYTLGGIGRHTLVYTLGGVHLPVYTPSIPPWVHLLGYMSDTGYAGPAACSSDEALGSVL